MLRPSVMVFAVLVTIGPGVGRGEDDSAKLAERLQGEWVGVGIEIQGTKGTDDEAKAIRVSIKGDEVTVRTDGPDRPGRKSTLTRLDPTKSPIEMDLLALERREKGKTQPCIVALDDDRLRLCGPLGGGTRPTAFKTEAKDGFFLFTLKRAGARAEVAAPISMPRYRLSSGEEITYRSETTNDKATYKVDWKVWVVDREPDGSWRLVIRCDLTMRRKGFGGKEETNSVNTLLWKCRLFDDGRLVGATVLGTVRDPFRFFPKLPDSPDDLANFWESRGPETEQVRIRNRLTTAAEPNGPTLAITSTQASPSNQVYEMDLVSRATFDIKRGLVTRSETEDSSGYPKKSVSRGLIELVSVESKDPAWLAKFARDADAYFGAVAAYEVAVGRAGRDAGHCPAMLADSRTKLQAARESIETACFRDELDQRLAQHDRTAKYLAAQANRRAEFVGKPAADWEAKDVDGKAHRMADYRGRVVVMDFWYRGCGWCMTAMPQVKQLSETFRGQPVAVLGMSIDEDEKDARAVIEAMRLDYPTIRAAGLPEKFGVEGYPTLIVVDRRGTIREVHVGYSPRLFDDLSALIREILAEKPAE